jgi:protein gp37
MGKTTIEWTATKKADGTWGQGYTFNPWIGCTEVSPACDNCYARVLMQDRFKKAQWGSKNERVLASDNTWKQPLLWNKKAEDSGEIERVFCASLADVFDAEVPHDWRHRLFSLIHQTSALMWLLLTKRPSLAKRYFRAVGAWPVNAWIGTTVESPSYLWRLEDLQEIPAVVRFASVEPLLAPFSREAARQLARSCDWVIVGGESGKGYREMPLDWAREIRDACEDAGTAFFFKQAAGKKEIPPDLEIREVPPLHLYRRSKALVKEEKA